MTGKKKELSIAIGVLVVAIVIYIWYGFWEQDTSGYCNAIVEYEENIEDIEDIEDEKEKEQADIIECQPPDVTNEEIESVDIPIDFASLQEINQDIYAWIIISGTLVDYPILQSDGEDQEFYLHHTFERLPSIEGSVFTQNYNRKNFMDRNTVIYGHDMLDGSIFGSLRNYKDEDFRRENDTIIIYTPYNILEYRIFSIVVFDNRHLMYAFCFDNEDKFYEFLDEVQDAREVIYWSEDIEVTIRDRIITLSTCTIDVDERLLIMAVLVGYQGKFSLGLH